ncbi:MAG: SigE family RNA polymerase sigma factor [Nocardioides sp.]
MASDDFSAYVAARGETLLRFAYVLTGQPADAQDAVQIALSRALPRWDRIRDVDDVDAYVKRMIVNAHVSAWRRFRRKEAPVADVRPRDETLPDPAEAVVDAASDEDLWRACSRLAGSQRVAIVLRYYEGLSFRAIAELVGCAEPTARSRVFRGLAALRADLGGSPSEDLEEKR